MKNVSCGCSQNTFFVLLNYGSDCKEKNETDTIKRMLHEKIKQMKIRRKNVRKKQKVLWKLFCPRISECLYFWWRVM